MSRDYPTNCDDVIDSRQVIERIEELQSEREALTDAVEEAEEGENYAADWRHGETLIRDSYFTEYAQQLAEDIGAISKDTAWPACHIDWDAAADALKQDYTSIDFDGTEFWVRS